MSHLSVDETNAETEQGTISVWAVEDSDSYRTAVVQVLKSIVGVECTGSFSSCEEAIESLGSCQSPEVILMDIHLPGMSGVEGVAKIRSEFPDIHIIMLTVNEDHSSIMGAVCAGATGYLLKTSSLEEIGNAILQVNQGGAPMTPRIARSVLNLFTKHAPSKEDYGLSSQERRVLELLVEGKIKKEVADTLDLSYHTVDNYVRRIYRKLHVHSLSAAVAKAIGEKLF